MASYQTTYQVLPEGSYQGISTYNANSYYSNVAIATPTRYLGGASYVPSQGELLTQLTEFFALNGTHSPVPWTQKLEGGMEIAGGVGWVAASALEIGGTEGLDIPAYLGLVGGAASIWAGVAEATGTTPPGLVTKLAQRRGGYQPEINPTPQPIGVAIDALTNPTDGIPVTTSNLITPAIPANNSTLADLVWATEAVPVHDMYSQGSYDTGADMLGIMFFMLCELVGTRGVPVPGNPYFEIVAGTPWQVSGFHPSWGNYAGIALPVLPAFSQLVQGDTVLSFLARTQPSLAWTLTGPDGSYDVGGTVWLALEPGALYLRCTLTDQSLAEIMAANPANRFTGWPGLSNVVLGSPTAFTGIGECAGPMDGALIKITTLPPGMGSQPDGPVTRYPHLGWFAFLDDSGIPEQIQFIQFPEQVAMPVTIAKPTSFVVFCKPSTAGTLTPWTATT